MVSQTQDGLCLFSIYCPHAGSVEILGDFTGPDAGIPMHADGAGWWRAEVRVPPGDRTFRYMVNGQSPLPDYAAGGLERDSDGMWVSCLYVPDRPGRAPADGADATAGAERISLTEEQLSLLRAGEGVEVELHRGGERLMLCVAKPALRLSAARSGARLDRGPERRRASRDEHRSAGGRSV